MAKSNPHASRRLNLHTDQFWNVNDIFHIDLSSKGDYLHLCRQDQAKVSYHLLHYEDDSFTRGTDREADIKNNILPN